MNTINRIGFLNRILLNCAGVSLDIMKKCPRFELTKYVCIGLTIVFTSILAVVSSYFAFSLIFKSTGLIIAASLLWGAIIFNLDRYIVSTMRSSENKFRELFKALPRLIIAFLIAVIISKPLEIQIFKSEIESYLMLKNNALIEDAESKYVGSLDEIRQEKKEINENFNKLLMLREGYYEDFKCECDGTCGTKKTGRGIECFSKKEKYELFLSELNGQKAQNDSILKSLGRQELKIQRQMETQTKIMQASLSTGLIDQIRALNEIDKVSSMFIIFIFMMVETAPILTKLLSTKGPYESLVLEYEKKFELNYLKAIDDFNHERSKNRKLKEMSSRLEIRSKESEMQNVIKQDAYDRYEKIRNDLEKRIAEN